MAAGASFATFITAADMPNEFAAAGPHLRSFLLAQEVFYAQISFWLNFAKVILLFLFPLSFAYAVVEHRVMDIPVLLKRSARYFMVERGFLFLIFVLSVGLTLWFGQAFSRCFFAGSRAAIPIGATFGVLMISSATQVHRRVRTRPDRAFSAAPMTRSKSWRTLPQSPSTPAAAKGWRCFSDRTPGMLCIHVQ